MSDISKIKINDTTYDIKDSTARTDAASAVNNKVSKTGDTMTGPLLLDQGTITMRHDRSTADSSRSTSSYRGVYIQGNNNTALAGWLESQLAADGNNIITLAARHPNSSGVNYDCGVRFIVHPDGSKAITLYDKNTWLSALGITYEGLFASAINSNTAYTLNSNKKFSDYLMLIFQTSGYSNFNTMIVPSTAFRMSSNYTWWLAPSIDNNNYITSFKYVSDTQFKVATKNSAISSCSIYGFIKMV